MKKGWIGFLAYTLLSTLLISPMLFWGVANAWIIKMSHGKQVVNIETEALVSATKLYQKGITTLPPEKQQFKKDITRFEAGLMIIRLFDNLHQDTKQAWISEDCNFQDLQELNNEEHKASIRKLCNYGLMKGFSDGNFWLSKTLTRGQTVIVVARMLNSEETQTMDLDNAYLFLKSKGIIKQDDRGTNKINLPITREELLIILSRCLKQDKIDTIIQKATDQDETLEVDKDLLLRKVFTSINTL